MCGPGYFEGEDGGAATFEQPASSWAADLAATGFTDVQARRLHGYWWADAWLVEGSGTGSVGEEARL